MISLSGKSVLVMGLGRFGGGVGVSRWLVSQGARVTVTDLAVATELQESVKALEGLPITFKLGGHEVADFLAAELLVINPAVDRAKSEVVRAALAAGVPATTEMNLFLERCPAITVGITGSVGKSTTTALIHEALRAGLRVAGSPEQPRVYLGGNIGRSLLLELSDMRQQDVVVLELSSFMLEETPQVRWSPHIAVVTNVFENHLDRHHTLAEYAAAKQNILRFQRPDDVAILNADHEAVSRWDELAKGRVVKFTTRGVGKLDLAMPGEHNQSNARAALAVVECLMERDVTKRQTESACYGATPRQTESACYFAGVAVDRAEALQAIETFGGLAHRLQFVYTWQLGGGADGRKIRFYNDSKATSPDASITALRAFDPDTAIFIVGGYDKHIDLSAFEELLAQRAGGVIGIGTTGQAIMNHVMACAAEVDSPRRQYVGTLEAAVKLARQWAREMPVVTAVVLSPASASWDQFSNYEKRGEQFAAYAQAE